MDRWIDRYLEVLSQAEREAFLPLLLTPLVCLESVANNDVCVSLGVKTRVEMKCNSVVTGANIHCKPATNRHTKLHA